MQWTTRVNEAYRTLRSPVQRAKYLLELEGVDVAFETNTAMPPDFLMRQMELREALEAAGDARDADALDALRASLRADKLELERALVLDVHPGAPQYLERPAMYLFDLFVGEEVEA